MEQLANKEKLDQIHQAIRSCCKCRLHLSRSIAVPGQGPIGPAIMFLGEAPGKAEDLSGLPS
jgi:uracil-DNA glycosylase